METDEKNVLIVVGDVLRPIAVVNVRINDDNPLGATISNSPPCSEGNVVQVAESTGTSRRSVMPRWTRYRDGPGASTIMLRRDLFNTIYRTTSRKQGSVKSMLIPYQILGILLSGGLFLQLLAR